MGTEIQAAVTRARDLVSAEWADIETSRAVPGLEQRILESLTGPFALTEEGARALVCHPENATSEQRRESLITMAGFCAWLQANREFNFFREAGL
jgi:hypothetical protein